MSKLSSAVHTINALGRRMKIVGAMIAPELLSPQANQAVGLCRKTLSYISSLTVWAGSSMVDDRELWASAAHILEQHGDNSDAVVAEHIGAIAKKGDLKALETCSAIADRMDMLRDHDGAGQARH